MQVYISQEHSCRLPKPSAGFVRVLAGTCQASTVPLHPMQIRAVAFCYLVAFGSMTSRKRRDRMAANER